jgi:hypothetical protein
MSLCGKGVGQNGKQRELHVGRFMLKKSKVVDMGTEKRERKIVLDVNCQSG